MDKFDIQRLRALPIESVAERLGLRVVRHKSLCPFHDDSHPSLSFSVSHNSFKCFACGAYGGVIDLAEKVLNRGFVDVCNWLADKHNVIMTEYKPVVKEEKRYPPDVEYLSKLVCRPVLNEAARDFLFVKRNLNPKVIEWCGISSISSPTPCWRFGKPFYDAPLLLFPYKDINGKVMNVQSRYLGPSEASGAPESKKLIPRFRFPSNSSIHIFNLPILRHLKRGEPLYISEGITDCLALLSCGHKSIAIPSATLLKASDLQLLGTLSLELGTTFHMYPDRDEPGERLYQQLCEMLTPKPSSSPSLSMKESSATDRIIRHDLPEGCKDYSDYYLMNYCQRAYL